MRRLAAAEEPLESGSGDEMRRGFRFKLSFGSLSADPKLAAVVTLSGEGDNISTKIDLLLCLLPNAAVNGLVG